MAISTSLIHIGDSPLPFLKCLYSQKQGGWALGSSSGMATYRVGIADAKWSCTWPIKVHSNYIKASRRARITSGHYARIISTCSFPTSPLSFSGANRWASERVIFVFILSEEQSSTDSVVDWLQVIPSVTELPLILSQRKTYELVQSLSVLN